VFSSTIEDHLDRLVVVLNRLRLAGLKLKPEKCAFFQKSVLFLGHVISEKGISTDPEKTRVISEWPSPTCLKVVRSFLSLASYYRKFVDGFAGIAAPLHALTKKGQTFRWTGECEDAFVTLKAALTSPPILAMPTDDGRFFLDTDASDKAIAAVLSQVQNGVERVVAYASRSLDRRECNYCVTRNELLAVVHFMRYFKQYLLGRKFTVRTDHAALTWLRRTPDPIGQQARWLEQMEEYDFEIEHRPGTKHGNADALTRARCNRQDCACNGQLAVNAMISSRSTGVGLFGGSADQWTPAVVTTAAVRLRSGKKVGDLLQDEQTAATDQNKGTTAALGGSADELCGLQQERNVDGNVLTSTTTLPWSPDGIGEAQRRDPDIGVIIQLLEACSEKPPWSEVALKPHDVKTLWEFGCG